MIKFLRFRVFGMIKTRRFYKPGMRRSFLLKMSEILKLLRCLKPKETQTSPRRILGRLKSFNFLLVGMMGAALSEGPIWGMELPDDVLYGVCSNLFPRELARVAPVSKQWLRVLEDEKLWQPYGVSSKKDCLTFPFSTLEKEHLVALFNCKFLSGNGLFFWKLLGNVETPDEIIKDMWPSQIMQNLLDG